MIATRISQIRGGLWVPIGALAALLATVAAIVVSPSAAQEGIPIPPPAMNEPAVQGTKAVAIFAGGCFWGVQGIYQRIDGVLNAVSGYAGGEEKTARYELVGTDTTGHAEAVEITYDPAKISYGKLLQVFFSVAHDPTQLNRQGPDIGSQYRSAIFPLDEGQAAAAKAYIAQLNQARVYKAAIVTKIQPGRRFYAAEDYHQDYLTLHPNQPYIVYNDLPKVENLKRLFADLYRSDPVLVSEARLSK